MLRQKDKLVRLHINLTEKQVAELDELVVTLGRTRSDLLREIVERELG